MSRRASSVYASRIQRFASHEWLPRAIGWSSSRSRLTPSSIARLLYVERERAISRSSASLITRPPRIPTTSPLAIGAVAKRPRPSMADGRTATRGSSQQRSGTPVTRLVDHPALRGQGVPLAFEIAPPADGLPLLFGRRRALVDPLEHPTVISPLALHAVRLP